MTSAEISVNDGARHTLFVKLSGTKNPERTMSFKKSDAIVFTGVVTP